MLAWGITDSFDDGSGFLLTIPLAFFVIVWAVVVIGATLVYAWHCAWWRALFLALALPATVPLALASQRAGNEIHLLAMLPVYLPKLNHTSVTQFGWGLMGFAGSSVYWTLVHDPADNVAHLRTEPQATRWGRVVSVTWLLGHFYLVVEEP